MYKKILALVLLVGCVYSVNLVKADAENVYIQYCADEHNTTWIVNQKTIMTDWNTKEELCLYFYTNNKETIQVQYDFTDSHLDTHGAQVCDTSTWFSKFFNNSLNTRILTVNSDKSQTIKENIIVPPWLSGMQMWCIAYYVIEDTKMAEWQMFLIRLRKALPLNLFIWSAASIKSSISLLKNTWWMYSTNSKIKATVDKESNLSVSFLVKNNWNVSQDINISWKVYNFLWFEKNFDFQQKIAPGETKELGWNVWILPTYKWFFTIKYTLHNIPAFDFVIEGLEEKDKVWWTISDKSQIYIFSWISLIVALAILLLIIKAFKPKRRQVSTTTQIPTTQIPTTQI